MVRLTPSEAIKGDIMLTSFVQLQCQSHCLKKDIFPRSANLMCGNEIVPQKTLLSYQISHLGEISILSGVGLNHDIQIELRHFSLFLSLVRWCQLYYYYYSFQFEISFIVFSLLLRQMTPQRKIFLWTFYWKFRISCRDKLKQLRECANSEKLYERVALLIRRRSEQNKKENRSAEFFLMDHII